MESISTNSYYTNELIFLPKGIIYRLYNFNIIFQQNILNVQFKFQINFFGCTHFRFYTNNFEYRNKFYNYPSVIQQLFQVCVHVFYNIRKKVLLI